MTRRLAKAAAAVLAIASVALAGVLLWSKMQERRFERAVAAAEAWNRTHWEMGSALRIAARMTYRALGEEAHRETSLTCFQKRQVDFGNGRRPQTKTVSGAVGLKSLFAVHREGQSYYIGPSGGLCAALFADGAPSGLPAPFVGDVVINEIPGEEASELNRLKARLGPACRLTWDTQQPINLGNGVEIEAVEILKVEVVPMSSALAKPEHMGEADAIFDGFVRKYLPGNPDQPARYEWSQTGKCWRRPDTAECRTEADDICGVPRL